MKRNYVAFYKGKKIEVQANSSYDAQKLADSIFKVKKSYEVAIVLSDVPVDTASL